MKDLDAILLFAFSDKAHTRDREAWRKFLVLLLPVLLEQEAAIISELMDEAHLDTPEALLLTQHRTNDTKSLIRSVSAHLSEMLGLTNEFGMSCFLDDSPHTKMHAQSARSLRMSEDKILAGWLKRFKDRQGNSELTEIFAQWKERLETLLESEQLLEDAIESGFHRGTQNDSPAPGVVGDEPLDDWDVGTPVPRSA